MSVFRVTANCRREILKLRSFKDLYGSIEAVHIAMQYRSIIVAIDYRAREMGKDYSLPLVERDSIETDLADLVESSWATRIHGLDFDLIETWKAQFGVGKP